MSTLTIPSSIEGKFGPAMQALNPRQQAFVMAFFAMADPEAVHAARAAGYKMDGNPGSIRVQAHALMHSDKIQAAMLEWAQRQVRGAGLAIGLKAILKIAGNAQHKDQAKAAIALMNRAGMHEIVERKNTHEIILSEKEKIEEIKQLALFLGHDPATLIGTITLSQGEYEPVPEGLEDVW